MTQTLLHRFQEGRSNPPNYAETHNASNFMRTLVSPSRFASGADVTTFIQTCPNCVKDVTIDHGERIQCDCGLFMEMYGNALTIWR